MIIYDPALGTSIDSASEEATILAKKHGHPIDFVFNGTKLESRHDRSVAQNRRENRTAYGLPEFDPPFHPVTALDALARWDKGETVFTIEMGGLGPGYEQAIQILIFEIVRDCAAQPLPKKESFGDWGDSTVCRIDEKCGGFSGAQVDAAKCVAYRAIRDGWGKMLESIPKDRKIQVSKNFPGL